MIDIINKLKEIDLQKDNSIEIEKILEDLDNFVITKVEIPKGEYILRGRPNKKHEKFYTRKSLQYPTSDLIKTFQRANTPGMSMFYGILYIQNENAIVGNNLRICAIPEILPWTINKETCGYQKLTYSKWVTKKKIKVASIVYSNQFENPHSYLNNLRKQHETDIRDSRLDENYCKSISEYLSDEFAKKKIRTNLEYQITAILSKLLIKWGFDGVMYPGVHFGGEYLNLAITPKCCDEKLHLDVVGTSTLYKNLQHMVLSNEMYSKVIYQNTPFSYSKVPNEYRTSEIQCLESIGLKDKKSLTNFGHV